MEINPRSFSQDCTVLRYCSGIPVTPCSRISAKVPAKKSIFKKCLKTTWNSLNLELEGVSVILKTTFSKKKDFWHSPHIVLQISWPPFSHRNGFVNKMCIWISKSCQKSPKVAKRCQKLPNVANFETCYRRTDGRTYGWTDIGKYVRTVGLLELPSQLKTRAHCLHF